MKHGHASNWEGTTPTSTYNTWRGMVQRCTNPNHEHYESYAGKLPERWMKFEAFLEDMGERPEGHTIERIDNELGYSKENCKWATPQTQVRNRSNNVLNESLAKAIRELREYGATVKSICTELGLKRHLVDNVIYKGYWKPSRQTLNTLGGNQ